MAARVSIDKMSWMRGVIEDSIRHYDNQRTFATNGWTELRKYLLEYGTMMVGAESARVLVERHFDTHKPVS